MLNYQKDQLFLLVKTLTKAEKRNFKLYANRFKSEIGLKFVKLFEVLDKMDTYDEALVLKKLKDTTKTQLANTKRHLYKQILISLRLIHQQKHIDVQIREQLDFARILYGKGMYMQSLRTLDRISKVAYDNHQDLLHLEILEFQKQIESRHITRSRSVKDKMESLLFESQRRSRIAHITSKLSNLNIQIQGWYIQFGHIHNPKEASVFKEYFNANLDGDFSEYKLTFFEKINLFQSHLWYHYVMLEFKECLVYARQWVNLFEVEEHMKDKDPDLYLRGLYYSMTFAFFEKDTKQFIEYLDRMKRFIDEYLLEANDNTQMIAFMYVNLCRLNLIFLNKEFEEAPKLIQEISEQLPHFEAFMDVDRTLLFYYKFACIYFCLERYDTALTYLNEIIHHKTELVKEDLHINALLLQMMCHYEMESFDFLANYLIPSSKRSYLKSKTLGELPSVTLAFFKKIVNKPEQNRPALFEEFAKKLDKLLENPIEQKGALYLNIPLWVNSQIKGVPIAQLAEVDYHL